MIYHWKTITQDIMTDPELQESLDDDITEICQKGEWEVWQIDVVAWQDGDSIIQRVITLRSSETVGGKLQPEDIPIMQSAWVEMRTLRNEIARWENTNAEITVNATAYKSAVTHFYQRVSALLGL